jgi:hypothetical protein
VSDDLHRPQSAQARQRNEVSPCSLSPPSLLPIVSRCPRHFWDGFLVIPTGPAFSWIAMIGAVLRLSTDRAAWPCRTRSRNRRGGRAVIMTCRPLARAAVAKAQTKNSGSNFAQARAAMGAYTCSSCRNMPASGKKRPASKRPPFKATDYGERIVTVSSR